MGLHLPVGAAAVSLPLQHATNARPAYVTFGIDISSTSAQGSALADLSVGAFHDAFGPSIDSEVSIGPGYVIVGTGGPEDLPYTGSRIEQGARVEPSSNAAVAMLLRKITSRPGRRGRGRMYIPWLCHQANVDENGLIGQALVDAVNVQAETFLTQLGTGPLGAPMTLLHNKLESDPAGVNYDPTRVDVMLCDNVIGLQRRRLNRQ